MMKHDACEYCDGMVEEVVTRVPFHYRRETIYVDNVPVRRCDKCGELYFPVEVYKELERIASGRKRIRSSISFPLADYRKPAAFETR
jgi:YgiT-type zinc finger domain-containing protein